MRFIFSILFIMGALPLFSQKNFEGTITYKGNTESIDNPDNPIKYFDIVYGKNKLKTTAWTLSPDGKRVYDAKYQIYDLQKDWTYHISPDQQFVAIDTVHDVELDRNISMMKTREQSSVLNQPCFKYIVKQDNRDTTRGAMLITVELWKSDKLVYIIPEKYRNKEIVSAESNGNVLFLASDTKIVMEYFADTGWVKRSDTIRIEAIAIKPRTVPESEFSIPASYQVLYNETDVREITIEDIKQEEEMEPPPPPPPPPPPVVPKPKKR